MARQFVYSLIFFIFINFQIQSMESLNQHQFKFGERKSGNLLKSFCIQNVHKNVLFLLVK